MFIRLLINEAALHKCLPENINDLRIYTKTRLSVKARIGNGGMAWGEWWEHKESGWECEESGWECEESGWEWWEFGEVGWEWWESKE